MSNEAQDLLERSYEVDGEELTGFEVLSGFYGLAVREQQFQDLYQSFRRYTRYQDFRESHPRKEKAYNDFINSFENYMGELEAEEEAEAHHTAAQATVNSEIFNGLSKMIGEVTEEDMRDLLIDIREETR